jgi:sterol desaturase/sphingolipid hydroxylase (fatty acid hydroxylase superfamily)
MAGDFFLSHEAAIRGSVFAAILAATAAGEFVAPKRRLRVGRGFRWVQNLSMMAIDALCLRFLFPLLAVQAALIAEANGWGLFNQLALPAIAAIPLTVLVFDLVIYAQHRAFHAVPLLWRLHMVHHADPDIDVTTGGRFHPIEIMLSMLVKMAVVLALGASAIGVIVFEVLLNATSMFNHGNLALPSGVDRVLRAIVVTPDMHRVHHSVRREETNSNFGFNVPWWDRLFGSYRALPQDRPRQSLGWLLILPFIGPVGDYPRLRNSLLDPTSPPPASPERST